METWSGFSRAKVANRCLGDVFEQFDETKYTERLNQVFDVGGQVVPLKLPDGRSRSHQVTITPIPAPRGGRWALFVLQDVTDLALQIAAFRGMREQALEAARTVELAKQVAELRNEQLQEVNTTLEQFAYVVSHDLNAPLRTLLSFSTFLRDDLGPNLPEAAAHDLEHIGAAAHRMQRLVEDLLALSRVSGSEIAHLSVPLERCIAESLAALGLKVPESGAKVVGSEELPTVKGDERLLTQLFQNLLGNAIKFTTHGKPPQIHLSSELRHGEWVISVRDNGIGIGSEYLEKVFDPLQRLHGIEQYPGSGMGLAICKRAVERHGGKIWAEQTSADGACFKFTLPVAVESA